MLGEVRGIILFSVQHNPFFIHVKRARFIAMLIYKLTVLLIQNKIKEPQFLLPDTQAVAMT